MNHPHLNIHFQFMAKISTLSPAEGAQSYSMLYYNHGVIVWWYIDAVLRMITLSDISWLEKLGGGGGPVALSWSSGIEETLEGVSPGYQQRRTLIQTSPLGPPTRDLFSWQIGWFGRLGSGSGGLAVFHAISDPISGRESCLWGLPPGTDWRIAIILGAPW